MADGFASFLLQFLGDAKPALVSIAAVGDALEGLKGKIAETDVAGALSGAKAGEGGGGFLSSVAGVGAMAAKAGAAMAAVGIAIAGVSLDFASKFDRQMLLVQTDAGDTTDKMDWLKSSVLALAGPLAQSPEELAKGLYHLASVGLRGADALDALHAAGQGATMSMAPMEDVSNALATTLVSYPQYIGNATGAMKLLTAIVGTGNMRFADLANALPNVLAVSKTVGLGLNDVGAALADLTDRGMGADEAATRLKMTFALMDAPSKAAVSALESVGLSADEANAAFKDKTYLEQYGVNLSQLSLDLRQPQGLLVALKDLQSHLTKSGLTAEEQSAVLFKSFGGGRSGLALQALYQDINRLDGPLGKYAQQAKIAGNFTNNWIDTTHTLGFEFNSAKDTIEAMAVRFGEWLTPAATAFMGVINDYALPGLQRFGRWIAQNVLPALETLGQGIAQNALPALEAFARWVQEKVLPALSALWGIISTYFLPALENLGNTIKDKLLPPIAGLIDRLVPILKPALVAVGGAILGAIYLLDGVALVLSGVVTAIDWIIDAVEEMVRGVPAALSTVGSAISGWASDVAGFFEGVWGAVTSTTQRFVNWLGSVFGPPLNAIESIFSGHMDEIKQIVGEVWNGIKIGLLITMGWLVPVMLMFPTIFRVAWDTIKTIFSLAWTVISTIVSLGVTYVSAVVQAGWIVVSTMFKVAWDVIVAVLALAWNAIVQTVTVAFDVIKGIFQVALDVLTGHWGRAWDDLKNMVGQVLGDIWHGIQTSFGIIVNFFKNFGPTVLAAIGDLVTLLVQKGTDLIYGLFKGSLAFWMTVASWLGGLKDAILGYLGGAITWLEQVGKDLIQGVINGAKSMVGSLGSAIKNVLIQASPLGPLSHIPGASNIPVIGGVFASATGGSFAARPGGYLVNLAEGGEDEDVVPASKKFDYALGVLSKSGMHGVMGALATGSGSLSAAGSAAGAAGSPVIQQRITVSGLPEDIVRLVHDAIAANNADLVRHLVAGGAR